MKILVCNIEKISNFFAKNAEKQLKIALYVKNGADFDQKVAIYQKTKNFYYSIIYFVTV